MLGRGPVAASKGAHSWHRNIIDTAFYSAHWALNSIRPKIPHPPRRLLQPFLPDSLRFEGCTVREGCSSSWKECICMDRERRAHNEVRYDTVVVGRGGKMCLSDKKSNGARYFTYRWAIRHEMDGTDHTSLSRYSFLTNWLRNQQSVPMTPLNSSSTCSPLYSPT